MVAVASQPSFCTEVRSLKALIKSVVPPDGDNGSNPADWQTFVDTHDSDITAFVVAAPPDLYAAAQAVASAIRSMPTNTNALESIAAKDALDQISSWMDSFCS